MKITVDLYNCILKTFRYSDKERGGLLEIDQEGRICGYYLDELGECGEVSYQPHEIVAEHIGSILKRGNRFVFAHSHREGDSISRSDKLYAKEFLEKNPEISECLMAVIWRKTFCLYQFDRDTTMKEVMIHIESE